MFKNFGKHTGKQLHCSPFVDKVAGFRRGNWHKCFLKNFVKFSEHAFYRTPPGDCLLFWDWVNSMKECVVFFQKRSVLKVSVEDLKGGQKGKKAYPGLLQRLGMESFTTIVNG